MAFGQGSTAITPVALADAYATFANGGTRYAPEVAAAVVSPSGKVVVRYGPRVLDHVSLPPAVRDPILQGLEGVVQNPSGTAYGTFQHYATFSEAAVPGGWQNGNGLYWLLPQRQAPGAELAVRWFRAGEQPQIRDCVCDRPRWLWRGCGSAGGRPGLQLPLPPPRPAPSAHREESGCPGHHHFSPHDHHDSPQGGHHHHAFNVIDNDHSHDKEGRIGLIASSLEVLGAAVHQTVAH